MTRFMTQYYNPEKQTGLVSRACNSFPQCHSRELSSVLGHFDCLADSILYILSATWTNYRYVKSRGGDVTNV